MGRLLPQARDETGNSLADSFEEIVESDDNVVWFTSNPSAIDGNLSSPEACKAFLNRPQSVRRCRIC
jgi:hypothetical protein